MSLPFQVFGAGRDTRVSAHVVRAQVAVRPLAVLRVVAPAQPWASPLDYIVVPFVASFVLAEVAIGGPALPAGAGIRHLHPLLRRCAPRWR
ncbi:MAG: hypothetical protein DRJ50_10275 [Actinobacteria bacterium]|nr:MAG: hypothetical protein DRJ50_10275 [Actinomycetota bacterium]